jgi:hypothetical protein
MKISENIEKVKKLIWHSQMILVGLYTASINYNEGAIFAIAAKIIQREYSDKKIWSLMATS